MSSSALLSVASTRLSSLASKSLRNPRLSHGVQPTRCICASLPYNTHSVKRSMVMVTQTNSNDTLVQNTSTSTVTTQGSMKHYPSHDDRVHISDSCWNRIRLLKSQKNDSSLYLRVFVDAGGCSGFTYQFELDKEENLAEDDIVFSNGDSDRVVIDEGSLGYLQGSTIDYVQEMIKSSFEVKDNPQSESACGCGSSFALKNFSSNPALD